MGTDKQIRKMNSDLHLKLQARLDGELPAPEQAGVDAHLASDPEARLLLRELELTRSALAAGELSRPIPESREFYWSKIEREIRSQQAGETRATSPSRLPWWRWGLAPATGIAMLAIALGLVGLQRSTDRDRYLMSASLLDPGAFTFRNSQEGVTLVWLSYPSEEATATVEANGSPKNQ
jgi:anti-sigma factor RsiW